MVLSEFITLVGIIIISVAYLIAGWAYPAMIGRLPTAIAALLLAACLARLYLSLRENNYSLNIRGKLKIDKNLAVAFLFSAACVILVYLVGFYIAMAILVFVLARLFGYKKIVPRIITTVVAVAFIYVVFHMLLKASLPTGLIGI